ncbi:MAG: PGPGW domain-containing protein, partial [Actinomycetota bacterium]|nr:PGPGW domain-containing protein [Actinomycetota bacterium]
VGVMVLLIGVFLSLPLVPGPGIVVILIGLTILASEWAWAERALDRAKQSGKAAVEQATASPLRIVLSVLVTLGGIAAAVWFFFLR